MPDLGSGCRAFESPRPDEVDVRFIHQPKQIGSSQPIIMVPVAQLVERLIVVQKVQGSRPC